MLNSIFGRILFDLNSFLAPRFSLGCRVCGDDCLWAPSAGLHTRPRGFRRCPWTVIRFFVAYHELRQNVSVPPGLLNIYVSDVRREVVLIILMSSLML